MLCQIITGVEEEGKATQESTSKSYDGKERQPAGGLLPCMVIILEIFARTGVHYPDRRVSDET